MSFFKKPQRLLSEERVKEMLGIEDFRHMTKQQAIEFVSAIPQMDPEVAVKALEQFPAMAELALGVVRENREAFAKALEANGQSSAAAYRIIDGIAETLANELGREDLTPEERMRIVEQLAQLPQIGERIHRDDQNFYLKALGIVGTVGCFAVAVCAAILGGNGRVQMPDFGRGGAAEI